MTIWEFIKACLNPSVEDLITTCFDAVFVYTGLANIHCLVRDKEVKGFDWKNMVLYVLWNLWSTLVIYPQANLYLANVMNVIYLTTQIIWIILYFKYKRQS